MHERDVAELHLKAITDSRLKNRRVIACGITAFNTDWCRVLREVFADDPKALARIPANEGEDPRVDSYTLDTTLAKSVLGSGDFIGIEETARETALGLWAVEASLNS